MDQRRGILFETLCYFWQRLFHRRHDPFVDNDEAIVDVPKGSPQQRAFVRAACMFPVDIERSGGPESGAVLNVSGSGVLFVTRGLFAAGERITVTGRIFDRAMRFNAEISRPDASLTEVTGLNGYGTRFTGIAEDDRQHIIRHIFAGYRRLRELNP